MNWTRLLFLYCGVLLLGGIFFGYRAWADSKQSSVIITWSTSSELDTAGFNLYRIDDSGNPDQKVNVNLIPAAPDPLIGGEYSYEDSDVSPGKIYQYELEEVEFSGGSSRFGPIKVEAQNQGRLELIISISLFILCGAGFVLLLVRRRDQKD